MLNRLLGMIYILMNRQNVTAAELAERFEVSVRTVYRDVETLSMAGIPVYTRKRRHQPHRAVCAGQNAGDEEGANPDFIGS